MDQLRGMYFRRLFRWEPSSYSFDTIGEAETYDFLANPRNDEAFDAAWTLEGPWTDEADDWLSSIESADLQVAIERCCHNGQLLPVELRALRLQHFPHAIQVECEAAIRALREMPGSDAALQLIYWWVRIERAQRTGCPDLDSYRSLLLDFDN